MGLAYLRPLVHVFSTKSCPSVFSSLLPAAGLLPTPGGANRWMWAFPNSDLSSVSSRMLLTDVRSPAIKYHWGASHYPQQHSYAPKDSRVYDPATSYKDTHVSYSMSTSSTQLHLFSTVIHVLRSHHSLVKWVPTNFSSSFFLPSSPSKPFRE